MDQSCHEVTQFQVVVTVERISEEFSKLIVKGAKGLDLLEQGGFLEPI